MSATTIISTVEERDFSDALAVFPVFQDLPDAVIDSICKNSDRRHYDAGHTVFATGQFDGGEFFVVVSGRMRCSIIDAESGAMMIEDIGEGSIFGLELSMSETAVDKYEGISAMAEDELVIIAVDASAFRELAGQRPSLMRNIAAYFAAELAVARFDPVKTEAAPHQRVYTALLQFVERDAATGQWRIAHMPKHRQLADQAGVEEAVTADAVASLIQEGVAQREYPGLVINDINRLNELAG